MNVDDRNSQVVFDPTEVIVIATDFSKTRTSLPASSSEADILFILSCIRQLLTIINGIITKKWICWLCSIRKGEFECQVSIDMSHTLWHILHCTKHIHKCNPLQLQISRQFAQQILKNYSLRFLADRMQMQECILELLLQGMLYFFIDKNTLLDLG